MVLALACGAAARPRVVVALRDAVGTISPFAPATIEGYRVSSLIYEPLARVDRRDQTLKPWLALSWTRTAVGVRVNLRRDVRFHDGTPLTAADVVATLTAFRAPANRAATWLPLWTEITSARALSTYVVEFRARDIGFESLRNLLTTLRIVSQSDPAAKPIGTGPFRDVEVKAGALLLTANAKWWHAPAPAFDLKFRSVADLGLARVLLQRGELDVFAADPSEAADDLLAAGPGTGFWIDLNLRREPFAKIEARRALAARWDRERLNQTVFGGRWALAKDAFDSTIAAYPKSDAAIDAVADGKPFAFELLVSDGAQERWATALQSTLGQSGIKMTIARRARDAEWWRRLRSGAFDAAAGGGPLLTAVNAATWMSSAAYNVFGLVDAKLDDMLRAQDREFDPARRAAREGRMIARLRERLPQIPGLAAPHGKYLVSKRVRLDPAEPDDVWRWTLSR